MAGNRAVSAQAKEETPYTNQFDLFRVIHIVLRWRANDLIPSNNQTVNDFKDLAKLDGIKIAYDLYAGGNLNREMIL